jgi:DNA mismatch repair ATPase MutS
MLSAELSDEYLATISDHLERLAFRGGVLMSADLGAENKGTNYVLRTPPNAKTGWMDRFRDWMEQFTQGADDAYVYEVAERDEAGYRVLSNLKSEGIASVARALTQSTDHILSFFRMLRVELGFYIGCLNLHRSLTGKGEPLCVPAVANPEQSVLSCRAIYDPCLSLSMERRVVGNDVRGDGKTLVVITGANRGGKSTLLRSLGQAQLMMQCGMFVAAESYRASLCDALFTHFKREEDEGMKSGKLDEELARMSGIVDRMTPHSLLLLNESFASTNEREGSEIARRIIDSILAMRCRVLCVTHMFDLAHGFYMEDRPDVMFLRAERLTDGERTFRLMEGEPLPTSYGEDLYRQVFGQEPAASIRAGG